MNKPLGGRGKKAPYETSVVRVPTDLIPIIDKMVDEYRISAMNADLTHTSGNGISAISVIPFTYQDILKESVRILKLRKSASESISRLLKFIYGTNISADDLKSGNVIDIDK